MAEEVPDTTAAHRDVPLHEDPVIQARRWFLLGVMCLSLVMVVMSVSGLNVALPSIQRSLKASSTELQWIVDAYSLVFAALLLPAGALGDRFGRKKTLLLGLTIFAVGSVIGGTGTGAGQVIAGRIVNGIGAAFVMPSTLSLITTIFPPKERRRAIAIWAGFAGAGGAIGPIVSGGLLDRFWWGSALLINIPIVLVVLTAVGIFSPTSKDPDATPLDPGGALISLVTLASLIYGIIEGPEKGWTSPTILGAFVVAACGLVGFVAWERRTRYPMLPLWLFQDRRMSVGAAVVTSNFFVMFGLFFLFTLYLQFVRSYSPLSAGLATLPLAVTLVAVAPRSAAVGERIGTGPVMTTGFTLIATGFLVMTRISPTTSYLVIAVALILLGAGMSLTAAPATGSIMSAVPSYKAGVGSAVNDTTREVGGALGIAVLGSISNAVYRSSVNLRSLTLPPGVAKAAGESVGAATGLAGSGIPDGPEVAHRAAVAYTHAFNVACAVAVAMALAAAAVVALVFAPGKERAAAESSHEPPRPARPNVPAGAETVAPR